jgi:hypothetical protein
MHAYPNSISLSMDKVYDAKKIFEKLFTMEK